MRRLPQLALTLVLALAPNAPAPAQTPPPDPPEALTDNYFAAAALLANRSLTPAEMNAIRGYLAFAYQGNFHDSLVRYAQNPPDWPAIARTRATWVQETLPKLLVFKLGMLPGGAVDPLRAGSSYQLMSPFFDDLARGGLTTAQVGYTAAYAELLAGGPLLPDEAAVLRAGVEYQFRKFKGFSLQYRYADGYLVAHLKSLPPADLDIERASNLKTRRDHVEGTYERTANQGEYAIDQAVLAAYERLNPGK